MTAFNNCKAVSFADDNDVVVYPVEDSLCPLWFAPEELVDLRNQVKEHAEHLKAKGYGMLLKNVFDENNKSVQKHINALAKLPGRECPRGTEVYLFHQHRDQVDRNHSNVVKNVLNRQRLLRQRNIELGEDKLRSISRKHSRNSRIFARRVGIADQRAINEGDDLWDAQTIIKELNQGNAKMAQRKVSVPDVYSLGDKVGGVSNMVNLAYMASRLNHSSSKIPDAVLSPSTSKTKNTFSNVIQDALTLLEDEDLAVPSLGAPSFMAKTA